MNIVHGFRGGRLEVGVRAPVLSVAGLLTSSTSGVPEVEGSGALWMGVAFPDFGPWAWVGVSAVGAPPSLASSASFASRSALSRSFLSFLSFFFCFSLSALSAVAFGFELAFGAGAPPLALGGVLFADSFAGMGGVDVLDLLVR